MRIGKWQFRPTLWPTVATLILLPVLIALGIWQLQRADYKRMLLAEYHRAAALPPVSLNVAVAGDSVASLPRYRHVHALGHYDGSRQILLNDMQQGGQVGYQVVTPLVLHPGGQIVLVNRGFIARTPGVKALPDVSVSADTRDVEGILGILPVPGLRLGKVRAPAGWPKLMLYPSHQTLAQLYGTQLLQPVLLLDAAQPDGFVRDWRPNIGFPPVRHDAYALQWFALALALVIIWIVVNSRHDANR
ncbi:MAG: SURF1 family protein [Gammaproteobacteria bacterium]|nr:SURF1 family protein [Gammaproteobacteria bacterium]